MALHKFEGFDDETNVTKLTDGTAGGTPNVGSQFARTPGGHGLQMFGGHQVKFVWNSAQQEVIWGTAIRFDGGTFQSAQWLRFSDGLDWQCFFNTTSDGGVAFARHSATAVATTGALRSAPGVLKISEWLYFECKLRMSTGTDGFWEVRINGVLVLQGTGITVRPSNTNQFVTELNIWGSNGSVPTAWLDDMAFLDTTGPAPFNDYLGDIEILRGTPTADGYVTNSTPTGNVTGGNRWQNVDEVPANTTDFNTLVNVGDMDAYITNLAVAGTGTIFAVGVSIDAAKTASGAGTIATGVRSNGVDGFGPNLALTNAYARRVQWHTLNPDGNVPWTTAAINGPVQALVKVTG